MRKWEIELSAVSYRRAAADGTETNGFTRMMDREYRSRGSLGMFHDPSTALGRCIGWGRVVVAPDLNRKEPPCTSVSSGDIAGSV